MTLAADWKTAKTAFETATGKKKPSEKFLGIFRQGTGIESALKEVDGAKDAAALRKALAKFNTAYTDYVKLLEKNAADPKVVPAADKAAYVTAIGKLKGDLKKIEADGENIGKTLGDAGGKEKVDANALKEADEHLKLREKGAAEAAGYVKSFQASLGKADQLIKLAAKQLDAAKAAGKSGNTMMHQVAVGVIQKCIAELEPIANKVDSDYDKATADSGTLMKARMDPATDKLPESVKKGYLPKSKDAFKRMSAATAEMTSLRSEVMNKVEEARALLAEAEGAGSTMKDPSAYLAQLERLAGEIEKEGKSITIKGDRVIKGAEAIDKAKKTNPPKEAFEKLLTLQEGQWARYAPDMKASRGRVQSLEKQTAGVPPGAREDDKVGKLVDQIKAAAADVTTYLDRVEKAGADLLKKIQQERGALG